MGFAPRQNPTPYYRNPHTVGANDKQRLIWSKFRQMGAFSNYDSFVGMFEIDSDSIYQSILNLVFECQADGSPDEALVRGLDTLPEFREMRRYVYGDPINAGLSFLGIMPTVVQILTNIANGSGNGDDDGDGEEGGGKSIAEKIKEYFENNSDAIGQMLQKGADEGPSMGGFSVDGEGSEIEIMNQMLRDSSRGYANIKKVMKAVGSMIVDTNAAIRDKRKNVPSEYAEVTHGRDLSRLMADGWMSMAVPELEDIFWAEWAREESKIMQIKGRERTARGPLVVLVDESGSMTESFDGMTAHEWARAILLTMCHIAQREHRPFHVVKFASKAVSREIRYTHLGVDAKDFGWLAASPMNGGTDFVSAFVAGFEEVERAAVKDRRADMVLLTDMEVWLHPNVISKILGKKKETGTKVFGVLLSRDPGSVNNVPGLVDEFHTVTTLSDVPTLMSAARFVSEK